MEWVVLTAALVTLAATVAGFLLDDGDGSIIETLRSAVFQAISAATEGGE